MNANVERLIKSLQSEWNMKNSVMRGNPLRFLLYQLKSMGLLSGDFPYLKECSSRLLVGYGFQAGQSDEEKSETSFGILFAIERGMVLYVPTEESVKLCSAECGFLERFMGDGFSLRPIPEQRNPPFRFSLGAMRVSLVPNQSYVIRMHNSPQVDGEENPTIFPFDIYPSLARWNEDLKPWLDHWLPE